jgi:hypothetical protein
MKPQKKFLKAVVYPDALPNKEAVDEFLKPATCSNCKLGELAYCDVDHHENLATFAYKCNSCNEICWITFSPFLQDKQYNQMHVISLSRHNDIPMKEELNSLHCPKCNTQLKYFKTDDAIAKRLNIGKFSSDILYCDNEKCRMATILIFWVPPIQYFERVLNIAKQISGSHEAKLIMLLSALEIYFEKIFTFSEIKIENGKGKTYKGRYQVLDNVNEWRIQPRSATLNFPDNT